MSESKQPNILFLITDQQQQETIRSDSACLTPHVDALAATGITFTEARTVNAICSPARASLMTGRLPHNHGMVDNSHCVEPFRADFIRGQDTLSGRLKRGGYRLGYFGKWHVERSNDPGALGFDEYTTEYHDRDFPRTIEKPRIVSQLGYNDRTLYGVHKEPVRETEEHFFYDRGIEFIKGARESHDGPWCAFISTNAPHDPYIASRETYDLYDPSSFDLPESFHDPMDDKPSIYRRIRSVLGDLTEKDYREIMACYYANCTMVDMQIGRVVSYLEETGQRDDTLIIFLSDHGDLLGAHGLLCKGVPAFDETYRIPMILSWPGQVPAGQKRSTYVSIIDLAPTVAELAGCGSFTSIDGESLVPVLQGDEGFEDRSVYAEFFGQRLSYSQRLVWKNGIKYVYNGFDFDELYDLNEDPGEQANLIDDPAYDEIKKEMAREMWKKARKSNDSSFLESEYFMYRFAPIGPETKKIASIYNRGA